MINHIRGDIKFTRIFSCYKCDRRDLGDTQTESVNVSSTEELKEVLDKIPVMAHYMPVGWVSIYTVRETVFVCPDCKSSV